MQSRAILKGIDLKSAIGNKIIAVVATFSDMVTCLIAKTNLLCI